MKWNNMGRGAKALAVSLALILGVTACSRDYTVAYLYVTAKTSGTSGLINAYAIDYQTGALLPLADSPIPAGKNPVAIAVLPDGNGLFVANRDDSTITSYNIGTDGKLYNQASYTVTGSFPTALAVDATGSFLYATYTYQTGYTPALPGPGGMTVFPINEKTNPNVVTLGTGVDYKLGMNPVGVAVSKISFRQTTNIYAYVIDQETNTAGTSYGVIRAFTQTVDATTKKPNATLTPVAGTLAVSTGSGFASGTLPAAIAIDPSAGFLYVTDKSTNQIYGNLINAGGTLTPMQTSPYSTGQLPMGITIDPRGQFVYVANYNSNTVTGYVIDTSKGSLTSSGSATVATGPSCVAMENSLGAYLYTSNTLDDSVSGERYDAHTGSMSAIQGTQFPASHLPTCAVAIANGSHPTSLTVQ